MRIALARTRLLRSRAREMRMRPCEFIGLILRSFVLVNLLLYNIIMLREKIIIICDRVIEYGILAIVFSVPIYFAYFQENFNIFDLNKLVVFRIIVTLILVVYVSKIFLLGKINFQGKNGIFFLTGLLLLSFLISSYGSIHPLLSWWGSYERQQGFYSLFNYLLFFILLILILRSFLQVKRIILSIILAAFLVCSYGIIQHFGYDPLAWKEDAFYFGRVFSSLGQPNFLGQYLILTLSLSLYYLIAISKKFLDRFFIAIAVFLQFYCLILTYSRAAWLGLAVEIFTFLIIWLFIKQYKKIAFTLIGLSLFTLIFIIGYNVIDFANKDNFIALEEFTLANRVKSIVDFNGGSNKVRLYYWQAATAEIIDESWLRKIIGYGPETLASVFVKYYRSDQKVIEGINVYPDRSHNAILDLILFFGLVGFIIALLFFYYIIFQAVKYLKDNKNSQDEIYWLVIILLVILAGYFVNNLFSFSLTVGYVYLYLILGLLWFLINKSQSDRTFNLRLTIPVKVIILVSLFLVCGLYIYLQNINALRADYYYMKVKKAEVRKDCVEMLDNMEKTVRYNPASTYYKERYLYHNLNCLASVRNEDQTKIYKNILDQINSLNVKEFQYSTLTNLAHAESLFAHFFDPVYYEKAESIYNDLIEINPLFTTSYKDLAKLKLWHKEYDQTIDLINQALRVTPPLDNPYLNSVHKKDIENELVSLYEILGLAYRYKRNFDQAQISYKKALAIDLYYLPLYKEIADVYYLQGKIDMALKYNLHGYSLNPRDASWPLAISLLYREKKDLVKAKEFDQKAMEIISSEK